VGSASAEVLLISALINTTSVGSEVQYGISAVDFEGYADEYNWLANYVETYASQPTRDIFRVKFPGFVFSEHTDIRSAADMVHTSANRRRITTAMSEATDQLHIGDAEAAYDTLASAKPKRALARPRPLLTDLGHLEEWGDRRFAVELPYPTLQRYTGGIRAGNLWYLAARPGQGKSAHLASITKRAVLDGNRVLFYSLEMSEEEVRARFHASLATDLGYPKLTLSELRDRRVDMPMYRKFIGELGERLEATGGVLDVHTPADGVVSPSAVAARCGEYDLTTIDYVGLMAADGGGVAIDDWRVMAKISNSLKTIALAQTDARLLCAAQINRDGETGSAPPKVKNLAQSDALGQDGDVVLTMRSKPHNVASHFSLEKNRHGTSGIHFYTTFDPNRGIYAEVSAEHVEDLVMGVEEPAMSPHPPTLRVIKSKDEL
jgi:replicative DNA helicase